MPTDTRTRPRIPSIDQFRGFSILLMVLANYLAGIETVPAYMKHSEDIGLTVVDLIAPLFILAIGLSYRQSALRRKAQSGTVKMIGHFLKRFLIFCGIGVILSSGEEIFGFSDTLYSWGVLQTIGCAGLIVLPFIFFGKLYRFIIGAAFLAVYQLFLNTHLLHFVLGSSHGGIIGTMSWAALLLFATVFADIFYRKNPKKYFFVFISLSAIAAALLLSKWVPISKNRVSASYVLISLGTGGLLFSLFHLFADICKRRLGLLSWWGQNPLVLYLLHFILLAVFVFPKGPGWYIEASAVVIIMESIFILSAISTTAYCLYRRKIIISV